MNIISELAHNLLTKPPPKTILSYMGGGDSMFNFFDYTPFVVIIGDIKGSKKLINRNAVQKQLRELLGAINQTFQATVASDFRITLGDEFQGLLYCGKPVAHILDRIEREMFPVKIRFGIGVGEITTDIRSSTTEIDGPAYNLARDMIDMLRASETEKMEPKTNVKIEIQGNT
ncbi:MAG TPA: SatD family protein, partial [Candidatus Limiplasma sp.]|nr:SatD family protein [Candidatus Limiplasma sp.]